MLYMIFAINHVIQQFREDFNSDGDVGDKNNLTEQQCWNCVPNLKIRKSG